MIKTIIRFLIVLLILIIGIITFLLSPMGLQITTRTISDFLPGQLTVKKISGILIGPVTIDDLHYEDKDQIIAIKQLRFNWHPLGLLNKQLHITQLDINNFYLVTSRNALPEKWSIKTLKKTWATMLASLKKRQLPFHITINEATVTNLNVIDPAAQIHVFANNMQFHIIFSQTVWDAAMLAVITQPQPLQLHIEIHGTPDNYTGQLALIGKQTNLELDGAGNRNALSIHTMKHNFLQGNVDLQLQLHWNSNMHWQTEINGTKINIGLIDPQLFNTIGIHIKSTGDVENINHNPNWNNYTTQTNMDITIPMGSIQFLLDRNKTWNVAWKMHLNSFSPISSHLKGDIISDGKVSGDIDNPMISAKIQGNLQTAFADLNHFDVTITGNLKQHLIIANLLAYDEKMHLKIDGRYDQGEKPDQEKWQGLLQEMTVRGKLTKTWVLQKSARLFADKDIFSLSPLCVTNKTAGFVCTHGEFSNKKIDAQIQANMQHFAWLVSSIKHVRIPVGKLIAHFHIGGTPDKPLVTGSAHLDEGTVILPRLDVALNHMTVDVIGAGQKLNVKAQAFTQNKPIQLQGLVDLSNLSAPLQFTITSNNALIVNTDEYKIYATANIKGTLKNKITTFAGTIFIPKALLTPNDFQTTVQLPEHDIVYIFPKNKTKKAGWELNNNFKLELGNDVQFKAFNLDAKFGGSVQLSQSEQKALFATGTIFVTNGTYLVYGQTLSIEPGSNLEYDNNLISNPTFTVRASKTIQSDSSLAGGVPDFSDQSLIVGVEVHGVIKAYRITFFSNRGNLSQADILSYILLGYRTSANTPGNTDLMLRALAAVKIPSQGLMGKQNIAAQIQQGLGLNEMGVESETTTDELGNPLNQQSAFVVGKSFTRRLFVRYSIGLLDQVELVQVRYLFKKNWGVQADSSSLGFGGDVLYTFSKD